METGLEGKPWYFGLAIGFLVGSMGLFLGYRSVLGPMKENIARQETELADLRQQIQKGEEAKRQLPQFEQRVARLESELAKLLRILPNRRNVHDILARFGELADEGDFNLTNIAPAEEIEREYFNEWPIALSVQGTYHNLARFFDRMSRFTRIINVDDLRINATRTPTPFHSIDASFVAKTFVYKDESEDGL